MAGLPGPIELRKVALGTCARDFGTHCVHEHACVRCPVPWPDPERMPPLEEIRANLVDRRQEARAKTRVRRARRRTDITGNGSSRTGRCGVSA
ncbi:hypothetical protein [Streptomyces halstedii]|uniref:hypothetical protein n=1 Tax=Streptomyces halstedii TaxID=1944 RepID=UPI0034610EC3